MPFREIAGHRHLLELLSRAIARDSLPPTLLFAGPEGVGKRRVAVAVAQALNCLRPRTGDVGGTAPFERDACGECGACRRLARGVHPDLLMIEPGETGSIKIGQIREAIGHTAYRPFEGRRRVVVVDEADALVTEAQNALLKVLEEPPPASVFVLISSRPDALLPTVRSRCPRLRFGRLTVEEIAAALIARGHKEPEARALSVMAQGSLGRALGARASELAEAREAACLVLARTARGSDARMRLAAAKELAERAKEREQMTLRLRALASLVRDVGILATSSPPRALANADLADDIERVAKSWSGERAVRAFTAVDRALGALEANANVKVVADWLLLQL